MCRCGRCSESSWWSSRPRPALIPDAAVRDLVADTIFLKHNRRIPVLKTKENSFVLLHQPMFRWPLAGGFLGLIAKILKIGNRYVDKQHIRKFSIHRSPPTPVPPIFLRFALHRRRRGILHLDPVARAARDVG